MQALRIGASCGQRQRRDSDGERDQFPRQIAKARREAKSTVAPTVVSGIPPAAQPPTGLGADAAFDVLARGCFDGDMGACDRLFKLAPIGSAYQTYGDTCAGRQPAGTFTYCRAAFPG